MEIHKTAPKDIVPMGQKFAFGAGNLTNQLLPAALGVFMFFLVVGFGMSPYKAGILAAIPRFLDAILDPIMGYISRSYHGLHFRQYPFKVGASQTLYFWWRYCSWYFIYVDVAVKSAGTGKQF